MRRWRVLTCFAMLVPASFLGAQDEPKLEQIVFLVSGNSVTETSNADVTVELKFDKIMDRDFDPTVKFGLAAPFELSVPKKGEGWISDKLWQGFFTVSSNNPETGDGEYIFQIYGAADTSGAEMDTTLSTNLGKTLLICRSGELSLNTMSLNFGTITFGQPQVLSVTLTNESCADLHVSNVFSSQAQIFSRIGAPSFTIPGNGSRQVQIRFSPSERREYDETLTIVSDDRIQSEQTIQLKGSAKGPYLVLNPSGSLNFGNVEVGDDSSRNVEVINKAADDPTLSETLNITQISTNNSVYTVTPQALSIAPGDTETVTVTFKPTAYINYSGRVLIIESNDKTQPNRPLTLNGTASDESPPPSVINLTATWSGAFGFTRSNFLPVCWDNPDDPSGIAEIWWKFVTSPLPPTSPTDTTRGDRIVLTPGATCADLRLFGRLTTGRWYCYVWLVDGNGNSGYQNAVETSFIYDITPPRAPTVTKYSPLSWFGYSTPFELTIAIPSDSERGVKDASEVRWKYKSAPNSGGDYAGHYEFSDSDDDPVTFTVPFGSEALCGDDTLYVWLADSAGNSSASNRSAVRYRFDVCAPKVLRVHADTANIAILDQTFVDTLEITDDVRIDSVKLRYRFGGAETVEPPRTVRRITGTDNYVIDIPIAGVTRRGIEYQVVAVDSLMNRNVGPDNVEICADDEEEGVWFPVRTRVSNDFRIDTDGAPVSLISGDAEKNYQLFSVPYMLDFPDVMQVFEDDLGTYDISQWRLFDYKNDNPQDIRFVEGDTARDFIAGRSYFVITRQENIVVDSGPGVTLRTVCPDSIRLYEGWNLIATPFNFPVDRDSLSLLNSNSIISLRSYENGWNIQDRMDPWKGYALYVTRESESNDDPIYLIVQPKAAPGRLQKVGSELFALESGEWLIQVAAEADGLHDRDNWVGVRNKSVDGFDELELAEPPVIGKFVRVAFSHPEWKQPAGEFSTDFRSPKSNDLAWEIEVNTNLSRTTVTLNFDFLGELSEHSEVFLFDDDLQLAQNLRATPTYTFRSGAHGSDKTLRLVVGSSDFASKEAGDIALVPDKYELLQNFPNPFNPETSIRYNLAEPTQVKLEIYDLLGRKVVTLVDTEQKSGYHSARWNGRDAAGRQVASGVYIYRLSTSAQTIARKMILMR